MPKLDNFDTQNHYNFSGVNVEDLGASEYTLATIVNDCSSSVSNWKSEMEKCLQTILGACKHSPRAENLMIRLMQFNTHVSELHGFQILSSIDPSDYDGILKVGGATALFDATHDSIDATLDYCKSLDDVGIIANAIIFVVTDGDDNSSSRPADHVKDIIDKAMRDEVLESIKIVLIGVTNGDAYIQKFLDNFQKGAGISQYIDIGNADDKSLAKVAEFVSQSISSTSQSLGTGAASASLSF